ncbi:MAG TPA: endo-1,4-beta-xylanase [Phycisphaerae bacterium]|nr:endo-1,4-beta-xylanase [Phycisphaerae bacterium]
MAFQSSGTGSGTDWTLSSDGYVGTYVTLANPGQVTFTVQASGSAGSGAAPQMDISVDDTTTKYTVTPGFNSYSATVNLPAGTTFVRTDFANAVTGSNQSLTIRNLNVSGASILNSNINANALAAADTYAANFRSGNVTVSLPGLAPGTPVEFKLVRNAFNFEGSATGSSSSDPVAYMAVTNPAPGTTAYNYQHAYNASFNTLEPSNAGKWSNNEATQGVVTMSYVDTLLKYATSNNMDVRMHNLIWGAQQPAWVNTLLTNAQSSNATLAASAKASLMTAINNRISYYVGGKIAGTTIPRGDAIQEMDVLNEALRTAPYWKIFGASGVAQVYNNVAKAAAAAGNPNLRLYTNEYNVFTYSSDPSTSLSDPYANWYRQEVDDIRNAMPGQPTVSGVGVQYYADGNITLHSPARMMQVMQNLSVTGLPISLTEFQVSSDAPSDAVVSQILTETMRMMYGSPNATTFGLWTFWAGQNAPNDAAFLYDANWNLTSIGQAYQQLLNGWSTDYMGAVGSNGSVSFNGTYGEYQVLIGGQTYDLTLTKGTSNYALTAMAPEPGSMGILTGGAMLLLRRRRGSVSGRV